MVAGVAAAGVDHAPMVTRFTAATRNVYVVPFVSPVIVEVVASETLSLTVVQERPPLVERCRR